MAFVHQCDVCGDVIKDFYKEDAAELKLRVSGMDEPTTTLCKKCKTAHGLRFAFMRLLKWVSAREDWDMTIPQAKEIGTALERVR
jgi:hypothetical protein